MISAIVEKNPDYGYRRIKVALAEVYSLQVNHKLLKKLLLSQSLQSRRRRPSSRPVATSPSS
jgi:hypothetical protein